MKGRRKIRRVSLEMGESLPPKLIGIASAESDYRISQSISYLLGIPFAIDKPVSAINPNGSTTEFTRFSSGETISENYSLITNKSDSHYLLPSFNNLDYLFILPEETAPQKIRSISSKLKKATLVTGVFIIDIASIKDKNRNILMQ